MTNKKIQSIWLSQIKLYTLQIYILEIMFTNYKQIDSSIRMGSCWPSDTVLIEVSRFRLEVSKGDVNVRRNSCTVL